MGEYAEHNGQQVKIGTCEDMYYLRPDQVDEIRGYRFDADTLAVIRFRFPFPDEDGIEPGRFADYSRGVRVPGYSLPAELSGDEHGSIQFSHPAGYLVSLPCPESARSKGDDLATDIPMCAEAVGGPFPLRVHRNGFTGHPVVRQQAHRGGHLVTLLSCGACGAKHRLDTLEDAAPVIAAFREEAERTEWRRASADWDTERGCWSQDSCNYADEPVHSETDRARLHAIADRIEAGYKVAEVV